MGLSLPARNLRSRGIREQVTGNSRFRDLTFSLGENLISETGGGGWFSGIADFFTRGAISLGGLIGRGISKVWAGLGLPTSFSQIGDWFFATLETLSQFDWNATDEELKQRIEGYNTQIWGIWGEVIGRGLGYITSIALGAGVAIAVPVIGSKLLAARIAGEVSKEALAQMTGEVTSAIRQTVDLSATSAVLRSYMSARNFIKRQDLSEIIGDDAAKWVRDKWGAEGEPELTFVKLRDERIEKIKHKGLRNAVEQGIDGWWDSLRDGMVIVTRELDSEWQASFAAQREAQGQPRAAEIYPDAENDRESFLIFGREQAARDSAIGLINQSRLLRNRDIGAIGPLTPEGLEIPEFQNYRLTLFCYSVPKPPWRTDDGKRAKKVELNVPNPRRNVRWDEIKLALGGQSGYTWGPRYAVGRFESRRKMVVYANSDEAAIARLNALALLSEDDLVSIQTGTRAYRRNESEENRRRNTQVYPAYLRSVVLRRNTDLTQPGRPDIGGQTWREQSQKIDLWRDRIPANGDQIFTLEVRPQP